MENGYFANRLLVYFLLDREEHEKIWLRSENAPYFREGERISPTAAAASSFLTPNAFSSDAASPGEDSMTDQNHYSSGNSVNRTTKFSGHRFLIIGGTSKAGTTSVFTYLSEHPEICASTTKETRFFLDLEYPLRSQMRCQRDGADAYLSFFDLGAGVDPEAWKLEATPDYLYGQATPRLIRETLPHVYLIFILRDPVRRLISFYQFGRQLNEIPQTMTFDEYVELQSNPSLNNHVDRHRHPVFYALEHGRYSHYLQEFVELFGRSAIHIAFYEELRRNSLAFMTAICRWAGIDDAFYRNYSFQVKNAGFTPRSSRLHRVYFNTRAKSRQLLSEHPRLRSALRQIGGKVNLAYRKLNSTRREEVRMSRATQDFVCAYYKDEPARLKELLAIEVPWEGTALSLGKH